MAASVFESPLFAQLFPTGEVGRLFTDSAEIRAMMLVEGALARVQGKLGVIPETSAAAISRAAMEIQIDPGALARDTGSNGVCVPALVSAFRTAMEAPEMAQHLHWGATSQDIIDSALMLRLRQTLSLMERDLCAVLGPLAALADQHDALPMPARTYGQHATPITFGAVVAGWGMPLLSLLDELPALRETCLLVSLSGAAGTGAALGEKRDDTRAELAAALNLADPGRSWHTDRTPILRICDWMGRVALALGKMGADLSDLAMTELREITLDGAGASSTMPQKQNPVGPSVLLTLSHQVNGLNGLLKASPHKHQRDGAAWFAEWMTLPQIVLGTASALLTAGTVADRIAPQGDAMNNALTGGLDMIYAETLSFALADHMPRPEAQAAVKAMCREAQAQSVPLRDLVARDWPQIDVALLFDPLHQSGNAQSDARAFITKVRALS